MKIWVRDIYAEVKGMEEQKGERDLAFAGKGLCPLPFVGKSCRRRVESQDLFFDKEGQIQISEVK